MWFRINHCHCWESAGIVDETLIELKSHTCRGNNSQLHWITVVSIQKGMVLVFSNLCLCLLTEHTLGGHFSVVLLNHGERMDTALSCGRIILQ